MPWRRLFIHLLLVPAAVMSVGLALAVALGGPSEPAPMAGQGDALRGLDRSGLPPLQTFVAADGQPLAFRRYAPASTARGSVTLLHGATAHSVSMHPMAHALAEAGFEVLALDVRGHGASGTRGRIAYMGQLESDLAAFARQVRPTAPAILVGFSAGGGLALRFAGGPDQGLFDATLLLAPFISQDAPTHRPAAGGWVSVGIPRIVGLTVLNTLGISAFNHLPVTRYALTDAARAELTSSYDFNLAMNFRPQADYLDNIARVGLPCAVLAGSADEAFRSEHYAAVFATGGQCTEVELLPGIGHVQLTLDASAVAAVVRQVDRLQAQASVQARAR